MDYAVTVSCVLAVILYLNTLSADFAYDDSRAIKTNQDLLPATPLINLFCNDFWGTPLTHSGSHKSYRPLCVLTFRLNYLLGELNPWGYHLGNVFCHALTTAVFTFFARLLLKKDLATISAGAIFASHPIHTEAVAGIVGRADVLACCLFILTVLCYMRYVHNRHGPSPSSRWGPAFLVLLLAAAGMLTKEQALTSLAVCAVYDVIIWSRASVKDILTLKLFRNKHFYSTLEGLGLLTVYGSVLLVFRIYFMGSKPPEFAPSDNPASSSDSLLTRLLTYLHLPALNAWMILCPHVLSFDWSMEAVPLLESISDMRNIITVLFYSLLVYIIFIVARRLEDNGKDSSHSSNNNKRQLDNNMHNAKLNNNNDSTSFYHKQNGHSSTNGNKSRKLYLNSMPAHNQQNSTNNNSSGEANCSDFVEDPYDVSYRQIDVIVIALAVIVFPFIPATNLFFYVGFVIAERILYIPSMGVCLLVGLGVEFLHQRFQMDKAKRQALFAGLCFLLFCFSLKTVMRNRDWQTEERLYTSGIKVNPSKAWGNLANIFNDKNDTENAEMAYRNALAHRSNMADVHYNLGILLQNTKRTQEALASYKNAIKFRPKLSVAYLNLGILLAQLGDTETAKNTYATCADLDTSNLKDPRLHDGAKISCLFNHGRVCMDNGEHDNALTLFQAALKRRPDHYAPQSIYNMMGELYFKQDNLEEAEKWYQEALRSKPDHIPAHLTMAKLSQAKEKPQEALEWLTKAKKLNPHDRHIDFHKAQFFASSGQGSDALKIFEEILPHSDTDFETIYNAAIAYREHGDQQIAEDLYLRAFQLKPNEPAVLMNLGAMYHMNKKYDKAEETYREALRLNPDSQVTKDNLQRLITLKKGIKKGS